MNTLSRFSLLPVFSLCLFIVAVRAQSVTVIVERANLRGTPSQNGAVVEEVAQDSVFELLKRRGAWFLVQTETYTGWLHGNTIRIDNNNGGEPRQNSETNAGASGTYYPAVPSVRRRRTVPSYTPSYSSGGGRSYIRGPRGGCYYINSNGNKTYVDRSLCN